MSHLIFLESTLVFDKVTSILEDVEFKLINIEELFRKKDSGKIEVLITDEELEVLKKLVLNSESIHIVFTENYFKIQDVYVKLLMNLSIESFAKVEIDNLKKENIQNAFDASLIIDKNEIDYLIAKNRIDNIVNKDISNILKWFFKSEEILTDNELKDLELNRLIIYALAILVPNQDKIDNFIPEKFDRVGIDYIYEGVQFRCKNGKKFKKDMQDELEVLFNIAADKDDLNMIEKFERSVKSSPAPIPLNRSLLQKDSSLLYGYSPKETMMIAKELFNGLEINNELVSLITTVNTNSTRIDNERKKEIYDLILSEYGSDYFFNGERKVKMSKDYEAKEAIIPKSFSSEYHPNKIRSFLTFDQFKIYSFIFYRTIASQMSNATYDDTEIVVNVGGEKFKAVANKIIDKGWYELGIQFEADLNIHSDEIELPHDLYVGMELKENKIEAVTFKTNERTPMRFSTGRFFDKTTKEILTEQSEITFLLDTLKDIGMIRLQSKNMITPTEKGKRIYYTLKEYCPILIDIDFILNTQLVLKDIKEGKVDKEYLIEEYIKQASTLREELKYSDELVENTYDWKVKEAKRIAKENGQNVPANIIKNIYLLDDYISKNDNRVEKFGICPDCKKGEIYEKEKGYFCNESGCKFVLWKNKIESFFEKFNKQVSDNTINDYIKVILKKGKIKVENFYYKENYFAKNIIIEFNEQYKNWSIAFDNTPLKKEVLVQKNTDTQDTVSKQNNSIESEKIVEVNTSLQEVPEPEQTCEHTTTLQEKIEISDIQNYYAFYIYSVKTTEIKIFVTTYNEENTLNKFLFEDETQTYIIVFDANNDIAAYKYINRFINKVKEIDEDVFYGRTIIDDDTTDNFILRTKDEILKQKDRKIHNRKDKY